jgi:hypothetical protein
MHIKVASKHGNQKIGCVSIKVAKQHGKSASEEPT